MSLRASVLLTAVALGSPAFAADSGQGGVAGAPPADEEEPPNRRAWGPVSLAAAVSTVRGPETGKRTLPGSQATLRFGVGISRDIAVEVEGLVTAGAGPVAWYGFDDWGQRPHTGDTPLGVFAETHPTVGGVGLLIAPRLGAGRIRLAGPRPVAMEVVTRVGVRVVWTRRLVEQGELQSVFAAEARPAIVGDLELRLPVSPSVDLGVAGTGQAVSLPQGLVSGVRTSVTVGLGATFTWSPGRDRP